MIVLSLGGSLINPGAIDVSYLRRFRDFILERKGKFIIVCGGGMIARQYMGAALRLSNDSPDMFGVQATRLNAGLIARLFRSRRFFSGPQKVNFKKVLCASGWKPGFSTDACAVMWAKRNHLSAVYNLTNVDYVYDKDPKLRGAKPIKFMAWPDYLKLIPEWASGLHAPFDPVAAKMAKSAGIDVYVLDGRKLNNLACAIDGDEFVGTVIS